MNIYNTQFKLCCYIDFSNLPSLLGYNSILKLYTKLTDPIVIKTKRQLIALINNCEGAYYVTKILIHNTTYYINNDNILDGEFNILYNNAMHRTYISHIVFQKNNIINNYILEYLLAEHPIKPIFILHAHHLNELKFKAKAPTCIQDLSITTIADTLYHQLPDNDES